MALIRPRMRGQIRVIMVIHGLMASFAMTRHIKESPLHYKGTTDSCILTLSELLKREVSV